MVITQQISCIMLHSITVKLVKYQYAQFIQWISQKAK